MEGNAGRRGRGFEKSLSERTFNRPRRLSGLESVGLATAQFSSVVEAVKERGGPIGRIGEFGILKSRVFWLDTASVFREIFNNGFKNCLFRRHLFSTDAYYFLPEIKNDISLIK